MFLNQILRSFTKCRAWTLSEYGNLSSLKIDEIEIQDPKSDEVQVRMEYSPINPADIRFMEGAYGTPDLPVVPGWEGAGVVTSIGSNVSTNLIGKRVATSHLGIGGAWSEFATVSTNNITVIPDNVAP